MHYQVVHHGLSQASIEADLISFNSFPQYDTHTLYIDDDLETYAIERFDGHLIVPDEYKVVWNRRAVSAVISPELSTADSLVAEREASMFVEGVKLICASEQRWVNDPMVERIVGQKPYQLHVARRCGLAIPRTIMTNGSRQLDDFISHNSPSILKTFYPVSWHDETEVNMAYAALLNNSDSIDISAATLTSNLVQSYIRKSFELRVFYFGGEVISVRINSQDSEKSAIDWRAQLDGTLKVEEYLDLPDEVLNGIKQFASHLNLQYGAFDFIAGQDGEFYFLECNPSGQFLFMEEWNPSIKLAATFLRFLTKDMVLSSLQRDSLADFGLADMLQDSDACLRYQQQALAWPSTAPASFHYQESE